MSMMSIIDTLSRSEPRQSPAERREHPAERAAMTAPLCPQRTRC
ncbi:hypothetical protein I545_3598 [Mycobacterium kansasii 662]|uniref:Uncharacterized protein n=1 Tax=Mycobacterium kansasii 662 TaxID=1299326 RepID=X7ZC49_MYCKA|nr:hypothetical protein I545_3598 [Mycobacterium kansasii 662]